jgi:hypothetical protein
LRVALRNGDKSLVGNSAYRRYLKTPDQQHFEIDEKRVAEDAEYDGLYVLRTNTTLSPLAAMLRYRTSQGRGHFPNNQIYSRYQTDLSPERRVDPRPRLFVPRIAPP